MRLRVNSDSCAKEDDEMFAFCLRTLLEVKTSHLKAEGMIIGRMEWGPECFFRSRGAGKYAKKRHRYSDPS